VVIGCYWVVIGCYWVLLGIIGCYWVNRRAAEMMFNNKVVCKFTIEILIFYET